MEEKVCYGCMRRKRQSPVCEFCGFDERQLNEENQLPIGTVLQGQYVIGRVLGQGGFGITYIGWDRLLEIPVAVKEYFPAGIVQRDIRMGPAVRCLARDQEMFEKHREKFLQEARTLGQLVSVPEIVQVRNFFVANNTAYIVMEYVQGITLKQMLRDLGRPMTVQEALEVMDPVLRGLEKVHGQGLVHRDISPDNIMLPDGGGVKLIDFGTARNMDDNMRSKSTESVLKPGFAPLEQYNSKGNLGTWTDVYALSATFHYLLTGKLPPDAPSRIEEGESLPLLERVNSMTPGVLKTLQKGLAIRAADRIQTVAALRNGLFARPVPVTAIPDRKPAAETKKQDPKPEKTDTKTGCSKKKGLMAALAACAAAALAVVLFAGGGKTPAAQPSGVRQPAATQRPEAEHQLSVPHSPVEEPRDVTLTVWASKQDEDDKHGWLAEIMGRFAQAHPEYNITWELSYVDEGEAGNLICADPQNCADVFYFANDQLGTLVETGVLTKLGGSYLEQVRSDVSQACMDTVTYTDGGVYAFPVTPNTWYMWYNQSVFTEADVKSLNTMLEKGVVSFPMSNSWYTASFLFGAGGTLFGTYGNDASAGADFSGGDCVLAVEFMTDLVKHRNFVDDCDGLGVDGMCNGTVHAMFSGGWDEDYLREAMGDNLACAVLPSFTVGGRTYQMRSFLGTKAIGVNPNAADIRAAMDLAAYMASPEAQQLHYQMGGVSPVAEACSQDPAVRADQSVAVEISQTEYAVVQPVIPEMLAYWDPMRQFGLEILNGSVTKKNASYSLNSVMEEINSR